MAMLLDSVMHLDSVMDKRRYVQRVPARLCWPPLHILTTDLIDQRRPQTHCWVLGYRASGHDYTEMKLRVDFPTHFSLVVPFRQLGFSDWLAVHSSDAPISLLDLLFPRSFQNCLRSNSQNKVLIIP